MWPNHSSEATPGTVFATFSCIDFFAYDVAICLNSLCFENQSTFNVTKAKNFIKGYNSIRELNKKEKEYLPILAQGAAMRFLVTRIYDYLKQTDLDGAIFRTKDPMEYLKRLEFHNSVKNYEDYF